MPKATRSWNRPSPSELAGAPGNGIPVAELGRSLPMPRAMGEGQEVFVSLARAPLGSRVFLESLPAAGPAERIQAFALPDQMGRETRQFRAVLPPAAPGSEQVYLPVAVVNGEQRRGEIFRRPNRPTELRPNRVSGVPGASVAHAAPTQAEGPLAFPAMTLLAQIDAELPNATVFGATPEGMRIAFYIADGHWRGPRIHGRYKAEGGDWLVVRRDGVAIPDVRATVETNDGALLYYELSGKIDLGPAGYERSLAGQLPDAGPFSAVARVSTASENWQWMNRLTLVGAGIIDFTKRRARYDLYSIQCDPKALTA